MFGATIRAAECWRNIKVTEFERGHMMAVQKELDDLDKAQNGRAKPVSRDAFRTNRAQVMCFGKMCAIISHNHHFA